MEGGLLPFSRFHEDDVFSGSLLGLKGVRASSRGYRAGVLVKYEAAAGPFLGWGAWGGEWRPGVCGLRRARGRGGPEGGGARGVGHGFGGPGGGGTVLGGGRVWGELPRGGGMGGGGRGGVGGGGAGSRRLLCKREGGAGEEEWGVRAWWGSGRRVFGGCDRGEGGRAAAGRVRTTWMCLDCAQVGARGVGRVGRGGWQFQGGEGGGDRVGIWCGCGRRGGGGAGGGGGGAGRGCGAGPFCALRGGGEGGPPAEARGRGGGGVLGATRGEEGGGGGGGLRGGVVGGRVVLVGDWGGGPGGWGVTGGWVLGGGGVGAAGRPGELWRGRGIPRGGGGGCGRVVGTWGGGLF